jgi:DMSO/TMAO reductase YedYZ molybdopterin-dependent catalytic subunit
MATTDAESPSGPVRAADEPASRHGLGRLFPATPPPGPFRAGFWRSPLRGPWLTAFLGSILLALMTVVGVTGFVSHAAYNPDLPQNAIFDPGRDLPLTFDWFAGPSWLYALNQGLHVNVGLVAIPFLLAKLWSVIPRLFAWPPVVSPAQALERLSIALLVSSAVFEFATGVVNVQSYYPFRFDYVTAHYYGAVVFVASLVLHVGIKTPVILRAYRERGVLKPLRDDLLNTRPEPADADGLVSRAPLAPSISRRGLLAFTGAGSLLLLLANVGSSVGGPLRNLAFLAGRRDVPGDGPNAFQVNKTFAATGIPAAAVGPAYALELVAAGRTTRLTRDELLALPQRTADLPIACVEGWSTTQTWTGVPIAELARRAGAPAGSQVLVESLQPRGILRSTSLSADQAAADDALLALRVNGADLSPDHGFPARVIVPAMPGVNNTKWVGRMTFA